MPDFLAAFKFARKFSSNKSSKIGIISFKNAFHGRTFGSLSATPNPKYQNSFKPLVPGFSALPFNDVSAVEMINEDICGVIVEPIQGIPH